MLEKQDLVQLATSRMPFGKYKGSYLIDLPESYLLWFAKQGFPHGQLGKLLALALEIDRNGQSEIIRELKRRIDSGNP
ncbi:MAG: DUF3820 family protein [Pseudomonadales bacterium]